MSHEQDPKRCWTQWLSMWSVNTCAIASLERNPSSYWTGWQIVPVTSKYLRHYVTETGSQEVPVLVFSGTSVIVSQEQDPRRCWTRWRSLWSMTRCAPSLAGTTTTSFRRKRSVRATRKARRTPALWDIKHTGLRDAVLSLQSSVNRRRGHTNVFELWE